MFEHVPEQLGCPALDPLFVPVSLTELTGAPRVWFESLRAAPRDVTEGHAIAGLRPLSVVIPSERAVDRAALAITSGAAPGTAGTRTWARIYLRFEQTLRPSTGPLACFSVTGQDLLGAPRRCGFVYRALLRWRQLRSREVGLKLTPGATLAVAALYTVPRPVHLVSCGAASILECFPMDLLGSAGDVVTLALRKTSRAHELLQQRHELVMSRLHASQLALAYAQAERRTVLTSPAQLGIPLRESPNFHLPTPSEAISYREVSLVQRFDRGSHWLLVGRVVGEGRGSPPPLARHLCHLQALVPQAWPANTHRVRPAR